MAATKLRNRDEAIYTRTIDAERGTAISGTWRRPRRGKALDM